MIVTSGGICLFVSLLHRYISKRNPNCIIFIVLLIFPISSKNVENAAHPHYAITRCALNINEIYKFHRDDITDPYLFGVVEFYVEHYTQILCNCVEFCR